MALGAKIAIGVAVVTVTVGAVVAGIVMKNNDAPRDEVKVTVAPEDLPDSNESNKEDIALPEPETNTDSDETTQSGEIIYATTKEECLLGIKQAVEGIEQGKQFVIRCNNENLTTDTSKSISVVYRWLLEEELHYNVYCMYDSNEYVDIYVDSNPYPHHVIPVNDIKNAPAKIKEYLDGLDNPVDEMIEVWCLNSEFTMGNESGEDEIVDNLGYLNDNIYLCEYNVRVQGGGFVGGIEFEGIERFGCRICTTSRVYSVSELAEYTRNKINTGENWYITLDVYLYSDSIGETNYSEIISTMIEKEGFGDMYKYREKYVRDGVVYMK